MDVDMLLDKQPTQDSMPLLSPFLAEVLRPSVSPHAQRIRPRGLLWSVLVHQEQVREEWTASR